MGPLKFYMFTWLALFEVVNGKTQTKHAEQSKITDHLQNLQLSGLKAMQQFCLFFYPVVPPGGQ